jgi:hypothetical protein
MTFALRKILLRERKDRHKLGENICKSHIIQRTCIQMYKELQSQENNPAET